MKDAFVNNLMYDVKKMSFYELRLLCMRLGRRGDYVKLNFVILTTIVSILATGIWIVGLGVVVNDQFFYERRQPMERASLEDVESTESDGIHIIALGDSLTRGTGDETGKGYVGYAVDELRKKTNESIYIKNFAIRGQTSAQLASQLKKIEVQRQIRQADVIMLTIGGNDLFQGGESLLNFSIERMNKAKETYLTNLRQIFQTIRNLNKEATVFYISLYNPFNDLQDAEVTSAIVRDWNFHSGEVAAQYPKIINVPTYDIFELNVNDYLYSDKFHPNKEGYKLIGERVSSLITFTEGAEKDGE